MDSISRQAFLEQTIHLCVEDNHDEIFPRINLLIFQDHLKYKKKPHKEELQAPQLKEKLECDSLMTTQHQDIPVTVGL